MLRTAQQKSGSSKAATQVINMRGCALHLFVQKCARKIFLLEKCILSVYCADMAAAVSVANITLSQDWRVNDSLENVLEIFEESLVEKDWLEMGVTSGENREYLEKLKSENWR